jgi:hypothetical protein
LKPNNQKVSQELRYTLNDTQLSWIAIGDWICEIYSNIKNDSSKVKNCERELFYLIILRRIKNELFLLNLNKRDTWMKF